MLVRVGVIDLHGRLEAGLVILIINYFVKTGLLLFLLNSLFYLHTTNTSLVPFLIMVRVLIFTQFIIFEKVIKLRRHSLIKKRIAIFDPTTDTINSPKILL